MGSEEGWLDGIRLKARPGRLGSAVYCVFTEGQAKRIGDARFGQGNYDVWRVRVNQTQHTLHVEEHPSWCGMDAFKEVLVPESLTGPGNVEALPVPVFFEFMGDVKGWSNPMYYKTIRVVVFGQKLLVFGRGAACLHLSAFDTGSNEWTALPAFEFMGDASGWGNPIYFETIQVLTVGQKLFVFGRGSSNLHLAAFNTSSQSWMTLPSYWFMGDAAGWSKPMYYKTIRLVSVGRKLFVLGRGSSQLHLAAFDISSNAWSTLPTYEFMDDAHGWSNPIYYETIRVATIEERLFVFGRGHAHLHLVAFDTASNSWSTLPPHDFMSDAGGWSDPMYYKTLHVVTVAQKLFVFGRGSSHLHLVAFDAVSNTWIQLPAHPFMGNSAGWCKPIYYETIRVITFGQRLFVFGRGFSHLHLAVFDIGSEEWSTLPTYAFMADATGWSNPRYYDTIRVVTVARKLFVLGRGSSHLHVAVFDTANDAWL